MPLPDTNAVWPPKPFEGFFDLLDIYDGWDAGDVERPSSRHRHIPIAHRRQ